MDTILQGIPHVICYIDDILVTGVNDDEHLQNLMKHLKQYGIRMKEAKCDFMKVSVEYLGHLIDAEGLHTTTGQQAGSSYQGTCTQECERAEVVLGSLELLWEVHSQSC